MIVPALALAAGPLIPTGDGAVRGAAASRLLSAADLPHRTATRPAATFQPRSATEAPAALAVG